MRVSLSLAMEVGESSSNAPPAAVKDPRIIARKYQLDLCKRAVEENIIVYLGTGCGKTHIAVLLLYELGYLIRKPSRQICVFLAPTIPLVRQQAMVIENSTDFKVRSYFGNRKCLKDHHEWEKEIEESEVLVMTPQILLQCLRHCFIRMELISLLIFDECHHAQTQTRHPYAQIMKEFYHAKTTKCHRIFGMTASPTVGKGGSNSLNYTKCINSLEHLLDAKVCSVDDALELESIVAAPDIKVYFYDPVGSTAPALTLTYRKKLEEMKQQSIAVLREKIIDSKDRQKKIKHLWKMHDNLIFCLENIGLWGAIKAAEILLSPDYTDTSGMDIDENNDDGCMPDQYLSKAASVLNCKLLDADAESNSLALDTLEEPFFSKKLLVLISILSTYRLKADMKCIIFVKRIIVARTLTHILGSLKSLDFWKCEFLVGFHSGLRRMSRKKMDAIVEMFCSGQVNLLVATNVAEEGLDIQTCCLVVRFDLPETVASYIQSRGRARMQKSEYVFLVERENAQDMKLLNGFISGEDIMNKEITCRTSNETFDALEEKIYKVYTTGASISTGCSVSLLHRYCDKLPRDIYFTPSPKFFYMDELDGTICRIILPPNAPLRQVESLPCPSKDEARRRACLNACMELHARGALTDYLLPGLNNEKNKGSSGHASECDNNEDEYLREELYEMLVPQSLRVAWSNSDSHIIMHSYYIRFVPIPEDRLYWPFGLFVKHPLPKEAETMIVDLHLAQGRIVKTDFQYSGTLTFDSEEIMLAQNFQEMWLKIILDRSEFFPDFVALGKNDVAQQSSSTFYLLIPVQKYESGDNLSVDWTTMRRCLSSQIFHHPRDISEKPVVPKSETLKLLDGCVDKCDIMGSLVFTPHNKLFFFVDGILDETNVSSRHESRDATYAEYYRQRFGIQLLYPEQPLLKAKQLFLLRNLLHNRLRETTEARAKKEQFVRLPAELCSLKIIGFSKDIGSSLSLLPSLMHRLENLLVAIELKDLFSSSFPEASEVRADSILEALTTEKCLERLSLERFEVLGDAFLKYVVGRHSFLSYEGLDEGQLTKKRSGIVKNSHLCELAIRNNLQVYVCDELFEPSQFFALGRPCKVICNADTESTVHFKQGSDPKKLDGTEAINVKCTKSHRWLHRKTIADVVEALVGAFLVESGFKAAIAFLQWIGIQVNFEVSDVYRAWKESENNMSLNDIINVASLEEIIGYKFQHRGLLLQAFVHPSYNKHPGGCYQKLEFLGDAVLEYLITSYLYSVYPDLKPGQITDMRSIIVNNNSFAHIAVLRSFHLYVIMDSQSLTEAVKKFESFVRLPDSERDLLEEPACPKVLGDVVESFIGAILLDAGFNLKHVWRVMLQLLDPALGFTSLQINPIRELCELCQSCNFELKFPDPVKDKIGFSVKVEVDMAGTCLSFSASNHNSKAARRMAAQEALSELKSLGHKHKHKSLEEIIQLSRKKEAELIGYDEEPINMDTDSIHFGKLALGKSEEASYKLNLQIAEDTSLKKSAHHKQSSHPVGSIGGPRMCSGDREQYDQVVVDQNGPDGDFENGKYKDTNGVMTSKSAKSQLYEICSANCWSPPSFECWKEEGPSHLRMFTYKVIVEVETNSSTSLECFSEAKPQKKAAQEHAAEGALWYLKHLGCTLKP